jgi:hypothetical protein
MYATYILVEKNEFPEVLNRLYEVYEILPSKLIRSINKKLSKLWGSESLHQSILGSLKNKNQIVTDYFMNILIYSIETSNVTKLPLLLIWKMVSPILLTQL